MPVDPNEPTYCLCHQVFVCVCVCACVWVFVCVCAVCVLLTQVSYGQMIGCDNPTVSGVLHLAGLSRVHLGGLSCVHLGGLSRVHLGGLSCVHLGGLSRVHLGGLSCVHLAGLVHRQLTGSVRRSGSTLRASISRKSREENGGWCERADVRLCPTCAADAKKK